MLRITLSVLYYTIFTNTNNNKKAVKRYILLDLHDVAIICVFLTACSTSYLYSQYSITPAVCHVNGTLPDIDNVYVLYMPFVNDKFLPSYVQSTLSNVFSCAEYCFRWFFFMFSVFLFVYSVCLFVCVHTGTTLCRGICPGMIHLQLRDIRLFAWCKMQDTSMMQDNFVSYHFYTYVLTRYNLFVKLRKRRFLIFTKCCSDKNNMCLCFKHQHEGLSFILRCIIYSWQNYVIVSKNEILWL